MADHEQGRGASRSGVGRTICGVEWTREMLEILSRILSTRLSARGMAIYQLLFVEELEVAEAAAISALSPGAVYAWRSRLRRQLHEISLQLTLVHTSGWPHGEDAARAC